MSVLVEAGADDAARRSEGRISRDVIREYQSEW